VLKKLDEQAERVKLDGLYQSQVELTRRRIQQIMATAGPHADLDKLLKVRVRDELDALEDTREEAKHVHRSLESSKRRGKWFRLDVFNRKFPNRTHDEGSVKMRTDRHGTKTQWIKVYNDEEGVEDFSEGSEDAVEHSTMLDAGEDVLDDEQVPESGGLPLRSLFVKVVKHRCVWSWASLAALRDVCATSCGSCFTCLCLLSV
jgi:hypothetical protein